MTRTGVTLLEVMVVLTIVGVFTLIGFPRIKDAIQKTNLRAARAAAGTYVATARQAAIQRGCRAVAHFSPSAGTVWVTVCPRMSPGSGSVDTIGVVSRLGQLYGVTMATSPRDSVQFDPRGLKFDNSTTMTVRFATTSGSNDSILVNQLGKVVH